MIHSYLSLGLAEAQEDVLAHLLHRFDDKEVQN